MNKLSDQISDLLHDSVCIIGGQLIGSPNCKPQILSFRNLRSCGLIFFRIIQGLI